ncbi:MAG: universal stress protein [Bacteroidota bacterium]
MKIGKGPIIIPWDFTEVAENALKYAVRVSHKINKPITLLHIVKKKSEKESLLSDLQKIAKEKTEKYDKQIDADVVVGKIFSDIGDYAGEKDAELVIMGTHGMKGMQKITGSWALKVIINSKVPFIVVQDPPNKSEFKKVVLPIDFKSEAKEKLNWVSYLQQFYGSQFYILKPNFTDSSFIQKTKANIAFCKNYLDNRNIPYELHMAEGDKPFSQETLHFAKKVNADLILIVTTKYISMTDYMLGAHEQYIIANQEAIPVMVINPSKLSKVSTFR